MSVSLSTLRARLPTEERPETPAIEDAHHPLNIWHSTRSNSRTIDSYFPPQHQAIEQHFDNFRQLRKTQDTSRKAHSRNHVGTSDHQLQWRERVRHTTWAYFTLTMATGGIANVLHTVPFRSSWLYWVGLFFFFLNIVLYVVIWSMILTRFLSYPSTFRASLVHPTESLFVPAFAVSLGTICITIVEYGANNTGQWLTNAVWVLFWFNLAIAITLSITIYMILWSSLTFTIAQMTPIWIFPAYPLLIIGPHAANLSEKLSSPTRALEVIIGGFTVQGIGFLVSLTIYSAFVYRLMTQKLPADPLRPGMFVSVGPAAFTCSGTIGMAANIQRALLGDNGDTSSKMFMGMPAQLASQILKLIGNWMGLWLWGLAFWFFFVSVISNVAPLYTHRRREVIDEENHKQSHKLEVHRHKIPFAMTWYSYIFPQTALTTATFRIADAFDIHALKIIGCVMTGLLVAMWIFVVTIMIRAIAQKQILWPEKGEDKEEGGFKQPSSTSKKARPGSVTERDSRTVVGDINGTNTDIARQPSSTSDESGAEPKDKEH